MTPELPLQHLTSPLFKTDDEYQAFREHFVEEMKNHLEQKMSSPTKTPRCDEVSFPCDVSSMPDDPIWEDCVPTEFARTLELELSARDEEIKRLQKQIAPMACPVCWTNSWEPTEQDDKHAIKDPTIEGAWMRCAHCFMVEGMIKMKTDIDRLREALEEYRTTTDFKDSTLQARQLRTRAALNPNSGVKQAFEKGRWS